MLDIGHTLMIGISSRALFDLEQENKIYEEQGLEKYCQYQLQHENDVLRPGAGFPLVKALLKLNDYIPTDAKAEARNVEVVIISRNSADVSLRIFNSIQHHNLDITRAAFTSGHPVTKYLNTFDIDLFLSASEEDVQAATEANTAAGLIYTALQTSYEQEISQIRIAFDGDAVLFSEESELIFQKQGLEAFLAHERLNAQKPLPEGPFAKVLKMLSVLQFSLDKPLIRTALITARNSPAHERVIRTLRSWQVRVDETFFLGGIAKDRVLQAFAPHIYFEDQLIHCESAAKIVPTARVLHKKRNQEK